MKTALSLCLALVVATSAPAEVFRSHIRSHGGDGYRRGSSVSIGYYSGYSPFYTGFGYGRGLGYAGAYGPAYSYYPGYDYGAYPYANYGYGSAGYSGSSSGAANGLLLGALAGGIIGNNSGEFRNNGWRGAAWGAGLGWLLGTAVDANRRIVASHQSSGTQSVQTPQAYAAPQQPQTQPVTIINNYYNAPATSMSAANGLFGR